MWSKYRQRSIIAAIGLATVFSIALMYDRARITLLSPCHAIERGADQVECIFRVIENTLRERDLQRAMDVFTEAYETFPAFVEVGCHKQAHRVGDIVYARLYRPSGDISSIEFPQETTACGYGFFHGFLEHIVQDNPEPEFVQETCTYLTSSLEGRMGSITSICYHGSGHGFAIAHVERLPESRWGNVAAITLEPAAKCDEVARIAGIDKRLHEECYEGVFNMLIEWSVQGEYGLSFDTKRPFASCDISPVHLRAACYYEASQKLDSIADFSPLALEGIVGRIRNVTLRYKAFEVGVAGIVQNTLYDEAEARRVFEECNQLEDAYYDMCLKSYVNGLFEHGSPQSEYKRALAICGESVLIQSGKSTLCYEAVIARLSRFYGPKKREAICREFPESMQGRCVAAG